MLERLFLIAGMGTHRGFCREASRGDCGEEGLPAETTTLQPGPNEAVRRQRLLKPVWVWAQVLDHE